MRVPTFYGAEIASDSYLQWLTVILLSVAFAAVHLLAIWLSKFPTLKEADTWVWLTYVIGVVPGLSGYAYQYVWTRFAKLAPLWAGIYILARIILFVLGFTTLRGLPPQALNTIHWPKFILIFIGN